MAGKEKAKIGRPRIEIDLDLLRNLAMCGCSLDEIAAMLRRSGLKVDLRTIKRRMTEPAYRAAHEEGVLVGKATLRSQMFRLARMSQHPSAATQMCIHLSKHWLGMTDKAALELSGKVDSEVTSYRERVTRKLDALAERIARRVAGIAASAGAGSVPAKVQ